MLGLRFCARAFSSCGERGPLFIAVRGPLTIAASLVAEHRLQTRRLSNCGSRAQLLPGMWDPPRPGLEPASPALAGGFSTTAPPGKTLLLLFCWEKYLFTKLQEIIFPLFPRYHSVYSLSYKNTNIKINSNDKTNLCNWKHKNNIHINYVSKLKLLYF